MLTKIKFYLKKIYKRASTLYTKKIETIDPINEKNIFSPGYMERVDCKEVIGLYLTLKEIDRVPTSMAVIHYGHAGVHIISAKPNGQIDHK